MRDGLCPCNDAVSLFSKRRDEFQDRIYKAIESDFKARGLVLEQLLIRNINLPESVKKTIESKINAEQEAQKMEFVLQKERQEAERKRVEAKGIADYQTIISLSLTDKQLQYEAIQAQRELEGSSNAKVAKSDSPAGWPWENPWTPAIRLSVHSLIRKRSWKIN